MALLKVQVYLLENDPNICAGYQALLADCGVPSLLFGDSCLLTALKILCRCSRQLLNINETSISQIYSNLECHKIYSAFFLTLGVEAFVFIHIVANSPSKYFSHTSL